MNGMFLISSDNIAWQFIQNVIQAELLRIKICIFPFWEKQGKKVIWLYFYPSAEWWNYCYSVTGQGKKASASGLPICTHFEKKNKMYGKSLKI